MPPRFNASSAVMSVLLLALSAGAMAQTDPLMQGERLAVDAADQPQAGSGNDVRFQFGGAYTHRFETDLDSGGNMTVDALSAGLNISTDLNRDVGLTFRINYGVSLYDFGDGGSAVGFGVLDPWDDIHTIAFGAAITADLNDQWSVFGGPVFQFARESGADWEKSFTGGVIGGATYAVSEDFVIGGGVGIVSQIEDSARFFPILIVEWVIDENWRVSSRGPSGGRTSIEFTGVELVWEANEQWEFALGGGSSFARFRLDDDTVAPDGVGQDESTPLWLRTSWKPTADINLDLVGGVALGGEVTLDDEDGDSIAGADTDEMTPFIGVFGSIRF